MAQVQSYFGYMSYISPTLDSNFSDTSDEAKLLFLGNEFLVYSKLFLKGETEGYKNIKDSAEKMSFLTVGSSYEMHLRAKMLIEDQQYDEAHTILYKLLLNDTYEMPEPMLYFIFGDLEVCCKEINDFKEQEDSVLVEYLANQGI